MDIQQSIIFVQINGSDMERARLNCILHESSPQPEVTWGFLELQNNDGGFPFGMEKGNLSTLNETTVALWWLEELNLLASPNAGKAYSFLLASQSGDGSWDENPQIEQYQLPPWIQLGDQKTRLYLSAYASYWLAAGGDTRSPSFRRAVHFLIRHQDKLGKFFGYLHTTWIAAGVLLMAGERYAKLTTQAIQYLSTKPIDQWADSQLAWALDCLSRGGLDKDNPFIASCLAELQPRQKPDGSWASEDGEAFAVSATIQVLKVLKRYGLLKNETGD